MSADLEQGTAEWLAVRCGKVTASRIGDLMARTKSGYSASRANYAAQLITERLTGRVEQGYTNAAMQWGTEAEPRARQAYEERACCFVEQVGFIDHPTIRHSGASPDGLVDDEGLIEIKCPNTATHIETLLGSEVDRKYILQMQWQMACTGRRWCDFVSFDDRLPPRMQLFVKRVSRDDTLIAEIESEVRAFLAELDSTVSKLTTLYQEAA